MALIAAEQAAKQKAEESGPEAEEALEPVLEATQGVIGALPLLDDGDIPDLGELTRSLRAATSARTLTDITRLAEEAGQIARSVEIALYERMEAEEAADERLVMMILDEEQQAFARKIHGYIRKLKRRR
jgi:hypothetical protein